ncbi:ATP-binding protein [Actinomadura scrupuli]|uniref:ATP-binding protein n=1 Tax=Actinomadura scrupuli TaxID=559629 RepID=UPI003D978E35
MNGSVFVPYPAAQSVEVQLFSLPTAARLSRRLVTEWFRHWDAPGQAIQSGELVVSELVTNAIKARGETIRMRIRWLDRSGYIEVWDADPEPPELKHAGVADENGRGLLLVEAYASRWDYYQAGSGKVVWAELTATRLPQCASGDR